MIGARGITSPREQTVDELDGLFSDEEVGWDPRRFFLKDLPGDIGAGLVIGAVLTLLLAPFMGSGPRIWIHGFIFNSLISICIGLAVANTFRFVLPPVRKRFPGRAANVALHVVLGIAGTTVGVEAAVRLIDALGGMEASDFRGSVLRVAFVVVGIILAAELGYSRLRARARRDELRAQQAHKQALRAELKALQARTNPHFLFNSLNTVAGLIDEHPEGAERVLEKLAGLFRYSLKGGEVSWVRLGEEIDAVRSYLEVESIRLGERLASDLRIEKGAEDVLVPPLVLQPLVENAVRHGIAPLKRGGKVTVTAALEGSTLILSVGDDGGGPGSSDETGSGTSLAELEERLRLLYGDAASFEAGPAAAETGFKARLRLPRTQGHE